MAEASEAAFRPNMLWRWWRSQVLASVEHGAVIGKIEDEAGWTPRYLFMTLLAAGIAVLGLLLSSPAVVIGAMLLSPLMGPIIGFGFSLALFDAKEMRGALYALALGTLVAVAFAAFIVLFSPIQTVTSEIAARTRPNLFDLLVAILSGMAGAYAMIRGRDGTIVGVAIATALMPPLATVGFGLATANWTVFGGALLLYFTNFMAIALSASVMARLYGFGSALSPRQTRVQAMVVIVTFVALAVPLGLTLRQIGWEALAARQTRDVLTGQFAAEAQVSNIEIDYDAEPLAVRAVVFTHRFNAGAEATADRALTERLGQEVSVTLDQVLTRGAGNAEAAQLAAASERRQAQDAAMAELSERLALIAGVDASAVTVDRDRRRAIVRAAELPGATLATYRALESRITVRAEGWQVQLIPPVLPLPEVAFDGDAPTEPGRAALALARWAGERIALPIGVAGPDDQVQAAVAALGARARPIDGPGGEGVTLIWVTPG